MIRNLLLKGCGGTRPYRPRGVTGVVGQGSATYPPCSVASLRVVEVALLFARLETLSARGRLPRPRLHLLLEEHVHEQVHGLGLDPEKPARALVNGIEVLDAIVVDDCDITRLPIVTDSV